MRARYPHFWPGGLPAAASGSCTSAREFSRPRSDSQGEPYAVRRGHLIVRERARYLYAWDVARADRMHSSSGACGRPSIAPAHKVRRSGVCLCTRSSGQLLHNCLETLVTRGRDYIWDACTGCIAEHIGGTRAQNSRHASRWAVQTRANMPWRSTKVEPTAGLLQAGQRWPILTARWRGCRDCRLSASPKRARGKRRAAPTARQRAP